MWWWLEVADLYFQFGIYVQEQYIQRLSFQSSCKTAQYTGNSTYADWAETVWAWETSVGLMDSGYSIYDGSSDTENCSSIDHIQWTYNAGIYLYGAAVMYNYTNGSSIWKERTQGVLNVTAGVFFTDGIMYEVACEPTGLCDTDELSFKAYLSRWMAATTKLASFTADTIMPLLRTSATAAAAQCDGGTDGATCGFKWTQNSTWDGTFGVGQQMSALEVIQANLISEASDLVTNKTGGTSQGNSAAGTGSSSTSSTGDNSANIVITTGSKAGAGILTAVLVVGLVGSAYFMLV